MKDTAVKFETSVPILNPTHRLQEILKLAREQAATVVTTETLKIQWGLLDTIVTVAQSIDGLRVEYAVAQVDAFATFEAWAQSDNYAVAYALQATAGIENVNARILRAIEIAAGIETIAAPKRAKHSRIAAPEMPEHAWQASEAEIERINVARTNERIQTLYALLQSDPRAAQIAQRAAMIGKALRAERKAQAKLDGTAKKRPGKRQREAAKRLGN
jgi:hypothetical protein